VSTQIKTRRNKKRKNPTILRSKQNVINNEMNNDLLPKINDDHQWEVKAFNAAIDERHQPYRVTSGK
jgi:hypothetical protein